DVLMAVEMAAAGAFGVVGVKNRHAPEAHGGVQLTQRGGVAGGRDEIVSLGPGVAGIYASADREPGEAIEDGGDRGEGTAKMAAAAGGIFYQQGKGAPGEIVGRFADAGHAGIERAAAGMEHEEVGGESAGAFQFSAQRRQGAGAEIGLRAGDVDEIAG